MFGGYKFETKYSKTVDSAVFTWMLKQRLRQGNDVTQREKVRFTYHEVKRKRNPVETATYKKRCGEFKKKIKTH